MVAYHTIGNSSRQQRLYGSEYGNGKCRWYKTLYCVPSHGRNLHVGYLIAYVEAVANGLDEMQQMLKPGHPFIAIGEVGLDYYWSREFEKEQMQAFERQVEWSIDTRLPLMIHCRKGQNEMVKMLGKYRDLLPGGVFHCFTGNEKEAEELLQFPNFVLGIGGVLTFKKSHLPEVLPSVVPLNRIVIETDSPYMAPVPMRGKRNESAYVKYVLERLAQAYGVDDSEVAAATNANTKRIFPLAFK